MEVCPVIDCAYGGVAPCTTVQANGAFAYEWSSPATTTPKTANCRDVVVIFEDRSGNALAPGSVAGGFEQYIP